MKKLLIFLLSAAALFILPLSIFAEDENFTVVNQGKFVFHEFSDHVELCHCDQNSSDTSATVPEKINNKPVTKITDYAFYKCYHLKRIVLPDSVTSIGERAFEQCVALTTVTLPKSCEFIGGNAFYMCTSLLSVKVPDGIQALSDNVFSQCQALMTVTLPGSLKTIGYAAFVNCKALKSLKIPEGVERIEAIAFSGCSSLSDITFPESLNYIGTHAFSETAYESDPSNYTDNMLIISDIVYAVNKQLISGSVTLSADTKYILPEAFSYCSNLEEIIIPASCTFPIEESTFRGCNALKNFYAPGITSIGGYAFRGCGIESVYAPRVKSVGDNAFYDCSSLSELDLSAVESIGDDAFYNCSSLSELDISAVESIGDNAFYYCKSLKELQLENLTLAADGAFYFSGLEKIYLPKLQVISHEMLGGCKNLTYVYAPEAKEIKERAFNSCSSLSALDLSAVESIENNAFTNCTSLKELHLENLASYSYTFSLPGLEKIYLPKLKVIPSQMLNDCENLRYVYAPEAEEIKSYAFHDCSSLSELDISSAGSIGKYAFGNCASLNELHLESLTSADDGAFSGSGLKKIYIPKLKIIPPEMFNGCEYLNYVYAPEAEEIKEKAFYECSSLSEFDLSFIKSIGINAFGGCASLKKDLHLENLTSAGGNAFSLAGVEKIYIPKLKVIPSGMFNGCEYLDYVYAPEAEEIKQYAFYNCPSLTSLSLPKAKTIDAYTFSDNSNLRRLEVDSAEALPFLGKLDNLEYLSAKSVTTLPSRYVFSKTIKEMYLSNFQRLDPYFFQDMQFLEYVDIGLVEYISIGAFSGCTSLREISLKYAKRIDSWAFRNCSSLEKIYLPLSLTTIYYSVFDGCTALTDVYYEGSQEDWANIEIDPSGNECLANAHIHFNQSIDRGSYALNFSEGFENILSGSVTLTPASAEIVITASGSFDFSSLTVYVSQNGVTKIAKPEISDNTAVFTAEASKGCSVYIWDGSMRPIAEKATI